MLTFIVSTVVIVAVVFAYRALVVRRSTKQFANKLVTMDTEIRRRTTNGLRAVPRDSSSARV